MLVGRFSKWNGDGLVRGWGKIALVLGLLLPLSSVAWASARDRAIKLHKRLTGVQPDPITVAEMVELVAQGRVKAAAHLAMKSRYFYDLTLKNWAATWTNREQNPVVPLNDAMATIVGLIRDNRPFKDVIHGDVIYVGDPNVIQARYGKEPRQAKAHYAEIESRRESLATVLQARVQSRLTGIADTAGILTTQAWGESFFKDGTNRRVWRFAMINFMCSELEGLMDTSIPGVRIRRDVDRSPAGSPALFKNKCLGCHATMDSAVGAASFFDYDEESGLQYRVGQVVAKVNRLGSTYPEGYITKDDSWIFLGGLSSSNGLSALGWRGPTSGKGLRSLATSIAESRGFSECMVQRVFKRVCLREALAAEKSLIAKLADEFEKEGRYNMKDLFASVSEACMGGELIASSTEAAK